MVKTVPAGAFKQGCLALLDEVSEQGIELVVTKRGRPVARVLPMADASERDRDILAELRSTTRTLVADQELLRPSSDTTSWAVMKRGGKSKRSRPAGGRP
jgi:prevent-host-death family protein